MRKPKVVILSAFLSPFRSGAEACVEEVAARLAEKFDVTIVTARLAPHPGPLPRGEGVVIVRVGFGNSFDKWLFPFLAPFVVRRLRPDIVHAVLETFAGAALWGCRWLVPSAKRVLTLQTTNRSFLKCSIIRAAHTVIAISSVLVSAAKQCGRDAVLIPNGVDYRAIREACARYPKVAGRVLFVGRLEPMKRVKILLWALQHVHEPYQAHIVGDGSQRKFLENHVKELGLQNCVQFLGTLRDEALYREYAEAEVFCSFPSSEALGNVFLEAQSAGCAVVTTRVGGIPDIVKDEETGTFVVVQRNDPGDAARGITRLLTDQRLRKHLSSAAMRHAAQYDWSGIAEKYARIYESALGRCWQR